MWKAIAITIGLLVWQWGHAQSPLPANSPQQWVCTVGAIQVYADELVWKMWACRTECYSWFMARYGAYDGADFWLHAFGKDTPIVWLRQKAVQEITNDKHRLLLMQSYGILSNYSFTHFLEQWQQENAQREERVAKGELVYGNINFNVYNYHSYLYSNAWLQTQRVVAQQPDLSTEILQQHYNTIRENTFKKTPDLEVVLEKKQRESGTMTRQIIHFTPEGRKTDELNWGEVFLRSSQLHTPGAVSPWFIDEQNDSCRVTCTTIRKQGYLPFREVLENVKADYAEMLLQRRLNEMKTSCPVRVNTAVLNRLVLE